MTPEQRTKLRKAVSLASLARALHIQFQHGCCPGCGEPFERACNSQRYCTLTCKRRFTWN